MIIIVILNSVVIVIAVMIHYEILQHLSSLIPKMKVAHRFKIVFGIFGALIAHILEIWIFAFVYYYMSISKEWGYFEGNFNGSLMDCVYFSFTTFTTLGFGDIAPIGDLRYLVGIESLTGLVLITWTASFLYYEMDRYWSSK